MKQLLIITAILFSTTAYAQTACETPQMACEPVQTLIVPEVGTYCTPEGNIIREEPRHIERKIELQIRRTAPLRRLPLRRQPMLLTTPAGC